MSEENRPCFNAAGFVVDLFGIIDKHIRGIAEPYKREILMDIMLIDSATIDYAETINMLVESSYRQHERKSNVKSGNEGKSNSENFPVQG